MSVGRTVNKMRHLPLILILLFAVLVFGQVCTHDYVSWDDDLLLFQDPYLNPPTVQSLQTLWTKVDAYHLYVPVTFTAWWSISRACGTPTATGWATPPAPFHVASLVVFLITVSLAYVLLVMLTGSPVAAGFGAAFYALHPLQVETVAWASELKDLLSGMFGLLTVLLFVLSRRRKSLWLYLLATVCFVLGILSKPNVVMLPLLVMVVQVWLERKHAPGTAAAPAQRPTARQTLLTTALWVLPWLAIGLAHALVTRKVQPPAPALMLPVWQRLFVAGDALAFYLGKLAVPLGLTADYGRMPSVVVSHWWGYVTWLAPALVLAVAIVTRRRSRWALPGLLWFMLALVPVLGLLPFDFQQYSTVADHYAYLALFGPALALAGLALHLKTLYARLPVVVLLALLAAQSGLQTMTWQNNLTFWQYTMQVNPQSFLAHNNLGATYQLRGLLPQAADQFAQALKLHPDDPDTTVNLGLLKAQLGDRAQAKELLEQALQLRPGDPKALLMLGMIGVRDKDYDSAISHLQTLLEAEPQNGPARYQLGLALLGQGRKQEARAQFEELLRQAPGFAPAVEGLKRAR